MEAAATPFPREETTPPVTKMYFGPPRKASEIPPIKVCTIHYEEDVRECQLQELGIGIFFLRAKFERDGG